MLPSGNMAVHGSGSCSRSQDPPNVEHDLESAFWVIFGMTLSYLETNLDVPARSFYLKETMNPRTYQGSGGNAKIDFMTGSGLWAFTTPKSPQVAKLIKNMHYFLGQRYKSSGPDEDILLSASSATSTSATAPDSMQSVTGGPTQQGSVVQDLHEPILHYMRTVLLEDSSWPKDDRAFPQEVALSKDEEYAMA